MTALPSTRRLEALPEPGRVLLLSKALAVLDRIMEPERPELRYFDFDPDWGGGALATMDSGEGDHYHVWFLTAGCVISGFDPDCAYAKLSAEQRAEEVYAALPRTLRRARIEFDDVSFACHWDRRRSAWIATPTNRRGRDPDGSERLLQYLDDCPETYVRHARAYYRRRIPVSSVSRVYEGTVDAETVGSLSDAASYRSILAFARRIGFDTAPNRATPSRSLPPAPLRKALAQVADPGTLAKRLAFMTLVDAIVSPRRRLVRLGERVGKRLSAAIGAKGELRVMVEGTRGCVATGSLPPSFERTDWTAWLDARRDFGAYFDGRGWRATQWHDAAPGLLKALQPNYLAWARGVYGRSLPSRSVTHLWQHQPLTKELALDLNASCSWEAALAEAAQLGWRVRGG